MAISRRLKKPLLRCGCRAAAHNYRVRQRLGWSHLRDVLIQVGIELGVKFTMTLTGAKLRPVQQPHRHLASTHLSRAGGPARRQAGHPCAQPRPPTLHPGAPHSSARLCCVWLSHLPAGACGRLKLSYQALSGVLCTYLLQTAWQILDPAGGIIARHEFGRKVVPDGDVMLSVACGQL